MSLLLFGLSAMGHQQNDMWGNYCVDSAGTLHQQGTEVLEPQIHRIRYCTSNGWQTTDTCPHGTAVSNLGFCWSNCENETPIGCASACACVANAQPESYYGQERLGAGQPSASSEDDDDDSLSGLFGFAQPDHPLIPSKCGEDQEKTSKHALILATCLGQCPKTPSSKSCSLKCYEKIGVSEHCATCSIDMSTCAVETADSPCQKSCGEPSDAMDKIEEWAECSSTCIQNECYPKYVACTDGERVAKCSIQTMGCIYHGACKDACDQHKITKAALNGDGNLNALLKRCYSCVEDKCVPEFTKCAHSTASDAQPELGWSPSLPTIPEEAVSANPAMIKVFPWGRRLEAPAL